MNLQQVPVEVRVEPERIDGEHVALPGEDCKHRLDAVQLLAVAQRVSVHQLIKHRDQVVIELQVDAVREPKTRYGNVKQRFETRYRYCAYTFYVVT